MSLFQFAYFQLVDGHSLFDYNVGLNEIIQVMVRPVLPSQPPKTDDKEKDDSSDKENSEVKVQIATYIFQVIMSEHAAFESFVSYDL